MTDEGDPTARLLQEEERSKLGESERIEVPDDRDVKRQKAQGQRVYPHLGEEAFRSQGQLRAAGEQPTPWPMRMARRPADDDDEVATSHDDPIEFAFRILKNIV